ncbi:hypothetical protein [Candidatus Halobonum tyrrellensis]|uniref:Glycosyltransferase n=1 Tax=Candidatus Halobonum tyrrellensis G22 TaxID=1324957 RepID=V4GWJ6_9EURY|nr:hypothetical protein [Candidatus Halobonum tyrrellensis]ESP89536.1 hypothetical protein K933_03230 [Candidatus Halobonum tyrrellensis G22]
MRVLLVPELYRPEEASANATLNDAVTWVEQWLRIDDTLHVYWLLPHRGDANYERPDVFADRDRVTLVEADPLMHDSSERYLFTESGYSADQLRELRRRIYDELGYVDVVVDQYRNGRTDLYKWLLHLSGHRADQVNPFDIVVNVHDLMLPFKYPDDGHRFDYHRLLEAVEAVLADGMWFKAKLDRDELPMFARRVMPESLIEEALDRSVLTNSPIDFERFNERYSDEPRVFHVAGSGWEKKRQDVVMAVAELLHEEYGIRTVITSMGGVPEEYAKLPWVRAHSEASRALYEETLATGDITVCATEYDTLARTWFEQAASGQVLVLRDEPWIYDCVPEDYPLVAPVDDLGAKARWVVDNWETAVALNRRLVEHVRQVRSPERAGRVTHDDMVWRVAEKVDRYERPRRPALRRAVEDAEESVALDALDEAGADYTADGDPLLDQEWCGLADLVFSLRLAGYADTGNPGTPVFRRESTGRPAGDGEAARRRSQRR